MSSDVSYEAYKANRRGPSPLEAAHFSEPTRVGMVAVKRAVFQSIASMSVLSIIRSRITAQSAQFCFSGPCQHLQYTQP